MIVSGDCTTSLGPVAGLQRAGLDVGIVWLDAHSDVQTLETSGYLGGLPRRLLHRPVITAMQPVVPRADIYPEARGQVGRRVRLG